MSASAALGEEKRQRVTGGTLAYRETGSGPPIVFVHGLLVNGDLWRKVVPELPGFRCITPDLPLGSHSVPFDPDADLAPPAVAELIAEFLDGLDLQNVTLVANDTGGAISQMLVAAHPSRVANLVLTPCDVGRNFLPPRFRYLQLLARVPGGLAVMAQSVKLPFVLRGPLGFGPLVKHRLDDEAAASYTATAGDPAIRRDVIKVLRGISTRDSLAALERLPQFQGRSLIVWGTDSKVFPRRDADTLAAKLPGARVEVVEDASVFVSEDQPSRLAVLIRDFAGGSGAE